MLATLHVGATLRAPGGLRATATCSCAGATPSVSSSASTARMLGVGWGRVVLDGLARTLTARWIAPRPLAGVSDAAALALRDRVDAAVLARDRYTVETRDSTGVLQSSTDVVRSAGYQATYWDPVMRHETVSVEVDDATDLPETRSTDVPYDASYAWRWLPVAHAPVPAPLCR